LSRSPFRIAALTLLAALLATNLYRAATQSIVHDEAFSWQLYLSGPVSAIFKTYTANNHFLATLLDRISITFFGPSEFAMRLPSVLAGAWFFWTVFRLCSLLFGEGWFLLLGCAALALNPILLDFFVAARGYGLAMAGLFWGLYQMLAWMDERARGGKEIELRGRLWKAALGCSVAVACNPTFLIPVSLLAAAFCVVLLRQPEAPAPVETTAPATRKKSKKGRPKAAIATGRSYAAFLNFIVPVAALALAFVLTFPVDVARTGDLYAAIKGLRSLINVSFAYGGGTGVLHRIERISSDIAIFFLPLGVVAALIVAWTARPGRGTLAMTALLSSLAVAGSAVLLALAHLTSGIPYPEDRTGIYFVPLATLAALSLAQMLVVNTGWMRWTGVVIAVVLVCFTAEFAAQWNVKSFWVWRYDADTKQAFDRLEAAKPANAVDGSVRLGVSWVYEPALNYYRDVRKAVWLAPVERDGFDGARQFYVLSPEDQASPKLPKMKPLYRGPVSGTLLAIPQ